MSIVFVHQGLRVEFPTLHAYERSSYWKATRSRYKLSRRPQECLVCGSEWFELHHLHYRDIGNENLDDLMPLCEDHHYEIEKHIRKAKGSLSREEASRDYLKQLEARTEGHRIRDGFKFWKNLLGSS